jgi:hypothetical protein
LKTKKTIIDSIGSLFLFGLIISILGASCSKDDNSTKPTDFSTLYAEITAAQNVLSTTSTTAEGVWPGLYPVGSKATLAAAIAAAYAVINQGGTAITPTQEAAATETLTIALTTYENSVNPIDPPGTVYVAGYIDNGATVWRNGVAISLPGTGAYASSVFVSGSNIYVAGYEWNGKGQTATVWKNGVATSLTDGTLTDGTYSAMANSVFVSGSDVYVAGYDVLYESNGTGQIAKIWKNGVATSLTDGTYYSIASSVFVSGSDVYVAGYEPNGRTQVAIVWKNGVATSLTDGTYYSIASSVFVSGSDVYVAGTVANLPGSYVATVWKNGVATSLAGTGVAYAYSVFVLGSDVYVAGQVFNGGGGGVATVWKNGVATSLTDGTNNASASSVFVSASDIYVAGYVSNGTNFFPTVWKNGVATSLTNGTNGGASSVFVTD